MDRNVTTDGMDPREDLSKYRLVIAPHLYCVDESVAGNLRRFAERGGVLCLTACSGVVDEYNKAFDTPAPGPLAEIAGVQIEERGSLTGPIALRAKQVALPEAFGHGALIAEEVRSTSAEVVATFDEGWRQGMPAVTVNEFGRGRVVYVATALKGHALAALMAWLCGLAGVESLCETPEDVRAYERRGDGIRLRFLLNYSDEARTVALDDGWRDALTQAPCEQAAIDPGDLRILIHD